MFALLVHLLTHVMPGQLGPATPCPLAAAAPETSGFALAPDAIGGLSPKEVKGRWPSAFG
jgi:hypothetical protein